MNALQSARVVDERVQLAVVEPVALRESVEVLLTENSDVSSTTAFPRACICAAKPSVLLRLISAAVARRRDPK
ncbi:MAG: hypothetical protein H0T91_06640 [Propionibacteriaceae bacterium]|nr:hypothetical protein [Propionibacteriaceae bacterium]